MKLNPTLLRRKAIKELIKTNPIENQASLVQLLKEKYGIETNQSIVSRDLSDMSVSKQKYKDTMIYELKEVDASKEILRLGVVSVEHNENLIVVTVLPGLAAFVGDYLDAEKEQLNLLGTLAGENMIFIAPRTVKKINETFKKVCELLHFKPLEDK